MPHVPAAADEARSDMTPMIDVVFLMIIFFVCIDFRTLEAKLPAYLPRDIGSGPTRVEPQEQLAVRVYATAPGVPVVPGGAAVGATNPATGRPFRYTLQGHRVRWEVGPVAFDDLGAAQRELARIAADPASQVRDERTGGRKLMASVVEAQPGVCYDDVAKATDALHAAGFAEICFGGGLGPARR